MNLDSAPGKELTLRGLLLGAALTVLFCAANIYLGLKIGLTFATSLPAAVISMSPTGPARARASGARVKPAATINAWSRRSWTATATSCC